MRRRHFTDRELLALLRAEAERVGRTPSAREAGRGESLCPVERVYCKRFGSWSAACRRAGLAPRRRGELARPERRPHPMSRIERFAASEAARQITERNRMHWEGAA